MGIVFSVYAFLCTQLSCYYEPQLRRTLRGSVRYSAFPNNYTISPKLF